MRRRRAVIRVHLLAVAAALAVAVSAGCASVSPQNASSTTDVGRGANSGGTAHTGGGSAVPGFDGGVSCPSDSTDPAVVKLRANLPRTALPADFHPVAAVRCMSRSRMVPGDGEWSFADADRADSGLAAMLAALRLPPQPTPTGQYACPAVGILVPPFALVDASGAVVAPILPQSFCGQPLEQVLDAMNALPWRTETEQKTTRLQTQAELDTGCSPAYKDLFALPVLTTPRPWSEVRAPAAPGPLKACVYTVPGDPKTTDPQFASGTTFSSAEVDAVDQALAAMDGTAPAPACATVATRFAMFTGLGLNYAVIELDGCHRIQWPNEFRQTAPASLLRALAAAGVS